MRSYWHWIMCKIKTVGTSWRTSFSMQIFFGNFKRLHNGRLFKAWDFFENMRIVLCWWLTLKNASLRCFWVFLSSNRIVTSFGILWTCQKKNKALWPIPSNPLNHSFMHKIVCWIENILSVFRMNRKPWLTFYQQFVNNILRLLYINGL